ncbi:MAG: 2-iminoacetate synthase ThiH [SAR324 cluster bacterium]|nr:2-iminoacetate synthase ThiH [SAR324 cluster bacterium]
MTFNEVFLQFTKDQILKQLESTTEDQVRNTLKQVTAGHSLSPEQFLALLSPQADRQLEQMAQISARNTRQRFGNVVQLYVPLYLSNECLCDCTYCGYSKNNSIARLTLNKDQILEESLALHRMGFRHILLLSGEDARYVNDTTLADVAEWIRPYFSSISIEVQPLKTEEYARLVRAGIDGLTVYQETYDREIYSLVHLAGKKKHFDYRLATPERGGEAGMRRINVGALLGLSDWRYDGFCAGLHASFLEKKFWQSHISVSLPRMRQAAGAHHKLFQVTDRNFVQLMTALRLFLPNAGITLSTRESASLRDHLVSLGVTQMSAGSRTTPGGYSEENHTGKQFEIEDKRTPDEVAAMLRKQGFDPVWKDWDTGLTMPDLDHPAGTLTPQSSSGNVC